MNKLFAKPYPYNRVNVGHNRFGLHNVTSLIAGAVVAIGTIASAIASASAANSPLH